MGADHEVAARQELREHVSQDLLLQRLRKVSEGDIAAQHDIERTRGRLRPQILQKEVDSLAKSWLHGVASTGSIKGLLNEERRQFT